MPPVEKINRFEEAQDLTGRFAGSVKTANNRTDAAAGQYIGFNTLFCQKFQDSGMCNTFRSTS
nr:hypothetical protein [Chryseobacterium taklimakanense]